MNKLDQNTPVQGDASTVSEDVRQQSLADFMSEVGRSADKVKKTVSESVVHVDARNPDPFNLFVDEEDEIEVIGTVVDAELVPQDDTPSNMRQLPKIVWDANDELALKDRVNEVWGTARALIVTDVDTLKTAVEFVKVMRNTSDMVSEFFKPMKRELDAQKKDVIRAEKELSEPVDSAMRDLNGKILAFQRAEAEKQRKAEEEAARLRKEEAERKLAAAMKAEEEGDLLAALILEEEAAKAESGVDVVPVVVTPPAVKGMSVRTDYSVVVENEEAVPVVFNGVVLRPVDKAALTRLAKASKGAIKIPGVRVIETEQAIVRR